MGVFFRWDERQKKAFELLENLIFRLVQVIPDFRKPFNVRLHVVAYESDLMRSYLICEKEARSDSTGVAQVA